MFINFTNHPSAQWSAEQKAAAQAYGEVIDLAFPAIDPAADEGSAGTRWHLRMPPASCT